MNFKNPSLPNLIMAMKKYIKSLSLLLAALSSATAFAQDTKTGYFLDEYTYRYQMNPAIGNDRGFVSMPALGNLNVGINGTLHLNSVIYNVDGRTTTFMNPQLSAGEVLGKFKDMNRIGTDLKLNVFSVGFNALGGYNTVSVTSASRCRSRYSHSSRRVSPMRLTTSPECVPMPQPTPSWPSIIAAISTVNGVSELP